MKKQVATIALMLSMVLQSAAQSPPGQAKKPAPPRMTLNIGNLGCTTSAGSNTFAVSSYSFGASNPVSIGAGGGIGSGKAVVSSFNLLKSFDECSPGLFGGVVQGTQFPTADFTQRDADNNAVLTISMTNVFIESWQIAGSSSDDANSQESLSIAFKKICITEPGNGAKLCYDVTTNKTF